MKKFLWKTAVLSIVVLGVIGGINYWIDPASLFGKGSTEIQIAEWLADSKIVAGATNIDERLLQRHYVHQAHALHPNHLVLGTSRSMLINRKYFSPEKIFFNSAVSGAAIQDVLAIFYLWEQSGADIRSVTLEVSLDWFNRKHQEDRWKTLETEYQQMLHQCGGSSETSSLNVKSFQLFSPSYFQYSCKQLFFPSGGADAVISDSTDSRNLRFPDGSIRYPLSLYEKHPLDPQEVHRWVVEKGLFYENIDMERMSIFEHFIDYLRGKNIDIQLLIPCYHPEFYQQLYAKSPAMSELLDYLKHFLASRSEIQLIGSFDPATYGLGPDDFFDVAHPKEKVYKLMFEYK